MLNTFIIALREGLEAALIVGILAAYINKTNRRELLNPLWLGTSLAVAASLGLGGLLSLTSAQLSEQANAIFAGTTSFIAVAIVTWMVFWMKRTARYLRRDLHGKVDKALLAGPIAIAGAAFFAVIREGLETSLFVYANFKTVSATAAASFGLFLGFAIAIALGYLIFKSSIYLDLSKFFKVTGIALIVVAAGVLTYGIHEFQEISWLPGDYSYAWNITSWLASDSLFATFLGGTFGFDTTTTWLQLGAWVIYLSSVLIPYLSRGKSKSTPPPQLKVKV